MTTASTHTEGPWTVSLDGSFRTLILGKAGRKVASTWTGNANVRRRAGEGRDAYYERARAAELARSRENEANARLIAAGFDMLEALKIARDALGANAARDTVDAAIAKVEGRS